jgi:hypothetical protein
LNYADTPKEYFNKTAEDDGFFHEFYAQIAANGPRPAWVISAHHYETPRPPHWTFSIHMPDDVSQCSYNRLEIRATRTDARAIARDIHRRLIPAATEAATHARAYLAKFNAQKARATLRLKMARHIIPEIHEIQPRSGNDKWATWAHGELRRGEMTAIITATEKDIDVNLTNITTPQALAVLRALAATLPPMPDPRAICEDEREAREDRGRARYQREAQRRHDLRRAQPQSQPGKQRRDRGHRHQQFLAQHRQIIALP